MLSLADRLDALTEKRANASVVFPFTQIVDTSISFNGLDTLKLRLFNAGIAYHTEARQRGEFAKEVLIARIDDQEQLRAYLLIERDIQIARTLFAVIEMRRESERNKKLNQSKVRNFLGKKPLPVKKYMSDEEIKIANRARYNRIIKKFCDVKEQQDA